MRQIPGVLMLMVEKGGRQHYYLGHETAALYKRATALDGRFRESWKGDRPPHHVAKLNPKQLGRLRGELDVLRRPGCNSEELVRLSESRCLYLGSRSANPEEALCAA